MGVGILFGLFFGPDDPCTPPLNVEEGGDEDRKVSVQEVEQWLKQYDGEK